MGSLQHRCPRGTACVTPQHVAQDCFKGGGPLLREFLGGGSGSALALTGWQGFNSPVFFSSGGLVDSCSL